MDTSYSVVLEHYFFPVYMTCIFIMMVNTGIIGFYVIVCNFVYLHLIYYYIYSFSIYIIAIKVR